MYNFYTKTSFHDETYLNFSPIYKMLLIFQNVYKSAIFQTRQPVLTMPRCCLLQATVTLDCAASTELPFTLHTIITLSS